MLIREQSDGLQHWSTDDFCVQSVEARDIDKDGTKEIVYFTSGGGSGTFAVKENHLSWPSGAQEPSLGFEYRTLQADSYYNSRFEMVVVSEVIREMVYGQGCEMQNYCPDWPEDAPCRDVMACEIAQSGTFTVVDDGFNSALRTDPDWLAFVDELAAGGIVIEGVPPDIENLSLQRLADLDTGERPELTAERKAMVEAWLR